MSRIVGIDLGTTNSLVAHVEGGIPRVIPDAEGRSLLPSVVAWTGNGVVVGAAARRQLARNSARTVYSVKRLMGRGYEDVKDDLSSSPSGHASDRVVIIRIARGPPPAVSPTCSSASTRLSPFANRSCSVTRPRLLHAPTPSTKDACASRPRGLPSSTTHAAALAFGFRSCPRDLGLRSGGGTFDIRSFS